MCSSSVFYSFPLARALPAGDPGHGHASSPMCWARTAWETGARGSRGQRSDRQWEGAASVAAGSFPEKRKETTHSPASPLPLQEPKGRPTQRRPACSPLEPERLPSALRHPSTGTTVRFQRQNCEGFLPYIVGNLLCLHFYFFFKKSE